MKKAAIACVVLLLSVFSVQAANTAPIDLVVVLDTSSSMHSARKDVSDYIVGPLLTEFLRPGDTFHLISFSGNSRSELSRRIAGPEDIETIIARLLLMHPLDPHTDFIAALGDVHRYLRELPESRGKIVVLVSDGEHSPPPGSPNAGLDADETARRIEAQTAKLKGNGWSFYFVKVPFGAGRALPALSSADKRPKAARSSMFPRDGAGAPAASPGSRQDEAPRTTARGAESGAAGGRAGSDSSARGGIGAPAGRESDASPASGSSAASSSSTADAAKAPEPARQQEAGGRAARGAEAGTPPSVEASTSAPLPGAAVDVSSVVAESLASPVIELSAEKGSGEMSAAVGTVFVEFPEDIGKKRRSFSIPVKIRNPSSSALYLETTAVEVNGVDLMAKRSFLSLKPRAEGVLDLSIALPDSQAAGPTVLRVRPRISGDLRLMPADAEIRLTVLDSTLVRTLSASLPYVLFAAGLALAVLLFMLIAAFARRSLSGPSRAAALAAAERGPRSTSDAASSDADRPAPNSPASHPPKTAAAAVSPQTAPAIAARGPASSLPLALPTSSGASVADAAGQGASAGLPLGFSAYAGPPPAPLTPKAVKAKDALVPASREYAVKDGGARILLSLWVQDQSRAIGKRNVHLMKAGATLSLGGGRSDFLVFLVPLPARIADVRFDGERCSLVPRRPAYFPDSGSQTIDDCLGKTVRVVSDKGYELFLRLERFEDPLKKLNSFLRSIDSAGIIG